MTDYPYDMDLVLDPLNPANVVANGKVYIYDPTDTAGTTPLALKDPHGLPLPNPLTSNAHGFLPPRTCTLPQVMWKSGDFTGYFNSYLGLRNEAVAAKSAAESAQASAAAAADLVDAPADIAVAALLQGSSQTATALGARVDGRAQMAVPPLVAAAIASDQSVAAAAAAAAGTAVSQELASRNVPEGGKVVDTQISFAVVDEDGRRTWIEADSSGAPTAYAADKIAEKAGDAIGAKSGHAPQPDAITNLSFAVVDEDGRRTWIEADRSGKPTARSLAMMRTGIGLDGVALASGPDIACPGDSLTAGSGGGATTYPNVLATLTGRTVRNLGVGGETSQTIAGRAGGRPWLATVAGGTIPASGGVIVTLAADDGGAVSPLDQGAAGVNPVILAGVEGTLTKAGAVYTFTRTANGSATAVNLPAPVITEAQRSRRGDITVMWWGQNDAVNDATAIISRQRATIEALTALDKRYLVIGLSTSSATYRAPMEAQFLAAYGRRFINIRAYLATYTALQDAGITPTAQDDLDISNGSVPTSLRVDPTHLNAAGYTLVAKQVHQRLKEMGWL